ncbi:VCBS domain-containing protein, partial [Cyanobium sp. Lug-B]|uniref:VCBS domain-containing protein n=1 Tax=Cyanobium sp. Lug-B TaxID=2823716 RepID=UPI0020CB9AE9
MVFDSRVEGLGMLIDALAPGAVGSTVGERDDALEVIAQQLKRTAAKRLAIVAHGQPGVVQLGALALDGAQIAQRADLLQEWGVEEIALYCCEVGCDQAFVAQLEKATGAKVAAATGLVGSKAKGGLWQLEQDSSTPYFNDLALTDYPGVLPITVNSIGNSPSDTFINSTEASSLNIQASITGGFTFGTDVLVAIFNPFQTLLYWTIYRGTGDNQSNRPIVSSLNLTTALGFTPDGSLDFKFYQGAYGGGPLSSSNYNGSFAQPPNFALLSLGGLNTLSGGLSYPNFSQTLTLDRLAPSAPSITSITDDFAPIIGTVTSGGSTNDTVLVLNGTAEANRTVAIFNGGSQLGTATANGSGFWTFMTGTLTNGNTYIFNARATDVAGNLITSANYIVTVDTNAPTAPSLALAFDTGSSSSDGVTQAGTVNVSGIESNATWQFSTNSGATWTSVFGGSGFLLAAGTYAIGGIRVRQTDLAGNTTVTPSQNAEAITIDQTNPAAPSFALASDSGSSNSDGVTNLGTVNVSGIESNASWQYSTDSGSTWITGSGSSFTLAAGTYAIGAIRVRQTDLAGNTTVTPSQNAAAITIDTSAPTDIGFSSTIIAENSAENAVVGTLVATDTTAVAYSLVPSAEDNASFAINGLGSGNELLIINTADFETRNSYSVQIRVTDAAGNFTDTTQTISITNVNETPTLADVAPGSYTDTATNDTFSHITGTLVGADVDAGTTLTYGISGGIVDSGSSTLVGTYGTLAVNATTGTYTYTPDATAINGLSINASDHFSFFVSDGSLSTIQYFTINITGTNDVATLTSDTKALTETDAVLSTGGTLTLTDLDALDATVVAQTDATGTYGKFSINAAGAWTYDTNDAVNQLNDGQLVTEVFNVATTDGGSASVTINITGTNDVATLTSDTKALTETDAVLSTGGTLTLTDLDAL